MRHFHVLDVYGEHFANPKLLGTVREGPPLAVEVNAPDTPAALFYVNEFFEHFIQTDATVANAWKASDRFAFMQQTIQGRTSYLSAVAISDVVSEPCRFCAVVTVDA